MMLVDDTGECAQRRSRDFRLLWSGNWMQLFGSRMSAASYPLLALAMSDGSPMAAGIVATAAILPFLLFQLPAGLLVDRWNRKRMMMTCAVGRALTLSGVVVTLGLGMLTLPLLVGLVFADVSFAVFSALAERSSIPSIVLPERLGTAISQNEARGRVAGLVGAPLGLVLFAWAPWTPYAVAAVSATVAAVTVLFIRSDCGSGQIGPPRPLGHELAGGLCWVRDQAFLRAAIPLTAASTGLLQIVVLAVVVVLINEQGHSSSSVGLVFAISGCGGVLGALTASWWMKRLRLSTLLVGGFAGWSVLAVAMALVTGPVPLGLLFGAMNLIGAVFGVAAGVYQMILTDAKMQGRVGAIAGLITAACSSMGAFLGGLLLDRVGGAVSMLVAGAGIAVVALVALMIPAVRHAALPDAPPVDGASDDSKEANA